MQLCSNNHRFQSSQALWLTNDSCIYMFKTVINVTTTFKNLGDAPQLNQFDVSLPHFLLPPSLTRVRCELVSRKFSTPLVLLLLGLQQAKPGRASHPSFWVTDSTKDELEPTEHLNITSRHSKCLLHT